MMLPLAPWLSSLVLASLKGSVILIVALLAVRAMRRSSAEARHAILAIGIAAFLIVPFATALAPGWTVITVPLVPVEGIVSEASGIVASDWNSDRAAASSGALREQPAPRLATGAVNAASASVSANSATAAGSVRVSDGFAAPGTSLRTSSSSALRAMLPGMPEPGTLLALVWLAGASIVALRLLLGIVRLRMLSRRATMVTDGAWLQAAHAIARRLGLTRGVTLLRGDREAVPMTWGVLSPVVWLPPAADRWPAALRRSVLSHELAHVRRRDAMMQWLANAAVALHWFNPLVWVATRALRAERERACDDAVLALGAAPDDYAAHLLDVVRALGTTAGPATAMAMARRSQFEGRLLAILDRACSRAPVGTARLAGAGIGALALVLVLGGVRSTEAARATVMLPDVLPGVEVRPAMREIERSRMTVDARSIAIEGVGRAVGATPRGNGDGDPVDVPIARIGPPLIAAAPAPAAQIVPAFERITPAREVALLSRSDTALLLDVIAAAEGISSSTDRTAVLDRVANLPDLAPTVVTALARAARRVPSSSGRAKLLKSIVQKQPHAYGESRRAVLDAVTGEMSSTDAGAVLEMFVQRDSLGEEALADAFTSVAKLSSSSEKARVLVAAVRVRKPEGAARAAYVKAAGTISIGSDRARVLSALLDEPPAR